MFIMVVSMLSTKEEVGFCLWWWFVSPSTALTGQALFWMLMGKLQSAGSLWISVLPAGSPLLSLHYSWARENIAAVNQSTSSTCFFFLQQTPRCFCSGHKRWDVRVEIEMLCNHLSIVACLVRFFFFFLQSLTGRSQMEEWIMQCIIWSFITSSFLIVCRVTPRLLWPGS